MRQSEGDWQAARDFSARGLAVGARDTRILTRLAVLEHEVGNFAQGEAHLEASVQVMRATPPEPIVPYALPALAIPLVARITGDLRRLDIAGEAAGIVLSAAAVSAALAQWVRCGLAIMAVLREDVATAGELYALLYPAGRGRMVATGTLCVGRVLGLLAQTMGDFDKAVEHFEDCLAFCRQAGYRTELAWTCCDYADTLLQLASTSSARTDTGDREKALSLLDESLAISSELGMRPLMERVLSRREILRA